MNIQSAPTLTTWLYVKPTDLASLSYLWQGYHICYHNKKPCLPFSEKVGPKSMPAHGL